MRFLDKIMWYYHYNILHLYNFRIDFNLKSPYKNPMQLHLLFSTDLYGHLEQYNWVLWFLKEVNSLDVLGEMEIMDLGFIL